ncbi:hypothetical protein [Actinokineospora terrae]|uniref:Uncharacterized protein n=1 Tax=Actinokineospora terrae TaxID=155974 RepID=A0A1H9TRM1_9PSEU|nr:hypothetical protein [Actinokineospora terrae]SER99940.1 hypothetical protein SAMN04487818_106439 [Actinokineospora terrae]
MSATAPLLVFDKISIDTCPRRAVGIRAENAGHPPTTDPPMTAQAAVGNEVQK